MDCVLQTDGLCKRYRHGTALDGLNMNVPKGAIYVSVRVRTTERVTGLR